MLSSFYLALMLDVISLSVNMGQFYSDFCLYRGTGFWLQELSQGLSSVRYKADDVKQQNLPRARAMS